MGFHISKLVVEGANVEPAIVQFYPGFNIIDGPSNTGKSYIEQCINYMTGGSDIPEEITEAAGYTNVYLEIVDDDNRIHCLKRALKGGGFTLAKTDFEHFDNVEHEFLGAVHDQNDLNTISQYLLKLSGFPSVRIKINVYNKTNSLSFRDIAKLIFIDEEKIITKKSPLLVALKVTAKEISIISYLLTGVDYSDLAEREKPEITKGKIKAQIDLIDNLLKEESNTDYEYSSIPSDGGRLKELNSEIEFLLSETTNSTNNRRELEKSRKLKWETLQSADSEIIMNQEILHRLKLLSSQYDKDLDRLEFLNEGNDFLSYLMVSKCPLCGRSDDHTHDKKLILPADGEKVTIALRAEKAKIESKKRDLLQTIEQLQISISERTGNQVFVRQELDEIDANINDYFEPVDRFQKEKLETLIDEKSTLLSSSQTRDNRDLQSKRDELRKQLNEKIGQAKNDTVPSAVLNDFMSEIEKLLTNWRYSDVTNVHFDVKKHDLIINNRNRSADGKGYRAITYSSFVIGLMKTCKSKGMPHPGVIVLDSPLTAYKKKDYDPIKDTIPEDIENAFFDDLLRTTNSEQIIVLDNKSLPEELKKKANYIHFTKDVDSGRYGFFPMSSKRSVT